MKHKGQRMTVLRQKPLSIWKTKGKAEANVILTGPLGGEKSDVKKTGQREGGHRVRKAASGIHI